ncbi:MAG: AbrB/MazE/SpoVT family DNA-binding domain-containing protein [Candidatus Woesearchaeota archaeon]|nr:AbrB/MazE/SpoVT family DNA-binding domain-containing protein [Candidatus Woesearchaeota archaeon]
MDIAITKVSSKGQIVIPSELRGDLLEGDKLVLIKSDNQFIIKKVSDFSKNLEEDLEFAKETEEAYKRIDASKDTAIKFDDFIEDMKKW